jgi:hypothetical protein
MQLFRYLNTLKAKQSIEDFRIAGSGYPMPVAFLTLVGVRPDVDKGSLITGLREHFSGEIVFAS